MSGHLASSFGLSVNNYFECGKSLHLLTLPFTESFKTKRKEGEISTNILDTIQSFAFYLHREISMVSCLWVWVLESDCIGLNMPSVIYCFWKLSYVNYAFKASVSHL